MTDCGASVGGASIGIVSCGRYVAFPEALILAKSCLEP